MQQHSLSVALVQFHSEQLGLTGMVDPLHVEALAVELVGQLVKVHRRVGLFVIFVDLDHQEDGGQRPCQFRHFFEYLILEQFIRSLATFIFHTVKIYNKKHIIVFLLFLR